MYILIFCISGDRVASVLYDALFNKGERNLRLVTDRELAFAEWLHEADKDGVFFTRIRLQDGFIIEPGIIKWLVNRLYYFQMIHFINQADRQYAEMEMYALYTSFLYSIKNNVLDGMPVRHIHSSDNTLYLQSMAVKAGIDTLDNQFTSSPRWQQPAALSATAPQKKQAVLWHRPSPHLVWENKPVLYSESFTTLVKAEIIGDNCLSSIPLSKQFRGKIKSFSKLTGRTVYILMLALVKDKYKLYAVDVRPQSLSTPAIEAFCALLNSKNTY